MSQHRTLLLASVLVATLTGCRSAPREPGPAPVVADTLPADTAIAVPGDARVEILWDTFGVPHIFARDVVALFFGFGWSQTRSHANLLLELYGQARGRAAEYWGAQYLEHDRWVRLNGIPERAREWWNAQDPAMRAYVQSFVEGINSFAGENPDAIPDSLKVVLPIVPTDVLAHLQRVVHFTFITSPEAIAGQSRAWRERGGSNGWAIGAGKSASGRAMLLANPHLPWSGVFTFYEAQLATAGMDAYGAALVGLPMLSIAFNDSIAWTHTVNTYDGADLYRLRLAEGGYAWAGGVRAFDTTRITLRVKQTDGTLSEEPLVVLRSLHGPVVAQSDTAALALRVAGLDRPYMLAQTWQMLRARGIVDFETALSQLQIPMFTTLYADSRGHILHVFNGAVPIRERGDWRMWSGIVAGDTPELIWTNYHAYGDLPRAVDPPSGWLQNANDPPWTTTVPFVLDPARFPPYMAPQSGMHFRAQRSARMLAEDPRVTFEEMIAYKHSTRMDAADHILEDVIYAARRFGTDRAKEAASVLESWDRNAEASSRGGILFEALMREAGRREWPRGSMFDVGWTALAPLSTPDGISDPRIAAEALDAAAAAVLQTHGALDTPWGDVYRLQLDSLDLPANGGPGQLGIFRVTAFERASDGRFRATGGDSYVAAIEFASPLRARALLTYGNASQPGSPHRIDQLPLYARKELRPVWRTREEIEANITLREAF